MGRTFSARGPFGPCPGLYDTSCPSRRSSKDPPSTFEVWKNMSLSVPVSMNPKPLSVNRLILPSAILSHSKKTLRRCSTQIGQAASPPVEIIARGLQYLYGVGQINVRSVRVSRSRAERLIQLSFALPRFQVKPVQQSVYDRREDESRGKRLV